MRLPDPRGLGARDLVAVSRTMSPGLCLAAYRRGIFPWPVSRHVIPWVSPDPRALFPLDAAPHWARSLRKTIRRGHLRVSIDRAFPKVIEACATTREGGTWITTDVERTYIELHELGWAHSVEVWDRASGELVGGLYGLSIGAGFAGESMFHRATDASKVAFVALVERLRARGFRLLDAQVMTEHLESLGCAPVPRADFLERLAGVVELEARFEGGDAGEDPDDVKLLAGAGGA